MDFNFINEHIPLYVEAAKLTLIMAFWGILLAIVVGLIVSLIRYFKVPVLDKIVGFYIELFYKFVRLKIEYWQVINFQIDYGKEALYD